MDGLAHPHLTGDIAPGLIGVLGFVVVAFVLVAALILIVTRRRLRTWRFGVFFESTLHDEEHRQDGDPPVP